MLSQPLGQLLACTTWPGTIYELGREHTDGSLDMTTRGITTAVHVIDPNARFATATSRSSAVPPVRSTTITEKSELASRGRFLDSQLG